MLVWFILHIIQGVGYHQKHIHVGFIYNDFLFDFEKNSDLSIFSWEFNDEV